MFFCYSIELARDIFHVFILYCNSIMRITRRSLFFFILVVIIGRVQQVETKKKRSSFFLVFLSFVSPCLEDRKFTARFSFLHPVLVLLYIYIYILWPRIKWCTHTHTQLGLIKIRFWYSSSSSVITIRRVVYRVKNIFTIPGQKVFFFLFFCVFCVLCFNSGRLHHRIKRPL